MDTFRFLNSCSATSIYVFFLSLSLVKASSQSMKYKRFADTKRLPISLVQLEEKSLPQCTIFCEYEPECRSVNYNSAEERCELSEHYPQIVRGSTEDVGVKAEHLTMEQASDWAIYYKPNPSCVFQFIVLLTSDTVGTITSPNYPNKLNKNENRSWLFIKPSNTSTLYLEFQDFQVGPDDCKANYVEIYNGPCKDAPVYPRFCKEETKRIVDSSGIYVLLNLITDGSASLRGFSLNYYIG